MNYIAQLKERLQAEQQAREEVLADVNGLLRLLHSPKHTGFDEEGERKDWIATADVIHWAREVRMKLLPQ
jgi:hypothetical protein